MYFDEYLKMMNNPSNNPRMEIIRFGRQNNTGYIRVLLHAKTSLNLKDFALYIKDDYSDSFNKLPNHKVTDDDYICIYINTPHAICRYKGRPIFSYNIEFQINPNDNPFVHLIYLKEIDIKGFELL